MIRKHFSYIVSLALLTSCSLAPHYTTPDLSVRSSIHEADSTDAKKTDVKPATAINWKDFFNSPEIEKLVNAALEHNHDLKIASLNVEAARQQYRIEKSDIFPSLSSSISTTRNETSDAYGFPGQTLNGSVYRANLAQMSYEIDFFGKIRSLNRAALEHYLATEEARNAMQISVIAETVNAYLQWLSDQKILNLVQDTLTAQKKSYDLIRKSYDNGIATRLDLAQARTAIENAKVNQALYQRLVTQDKYALQLLLGTHQYDLLTPKTTLNDIKFLDTLPSHIASDALLQRPDIKRSEHELKAANANIGAARAAFFPSISLTGSFGFASRELDQLFTDNAFGAWSYTPELVLPLFQGGKNRANLGLSKVQKEILVTTYHKSIHQAFKEVADELITRKTLKTQIDAQQALVDAYQESYDLSDTRYKQGIDRYLNVLDAQRSLLAAQQELITLEKQSLSNLVNLYKALGGGLK